MKRSILKKPTVKPVRATKKQVEIRVRRISILHNFMSVTEIAELFKVDRTTIYHYLNKINL